MACTPLVSFLSILALTFVATDNTTDYIHQLEQKISDLESHTRAAEQKEASVLASILSKLQSQEQVIQENKKELQNLTKSNVTEYIHQLEQEISDLKNHTQDIEQKHAVVLAIILSKLQSQEQVIQESKDELQNLTKANVTGQRIAFEASITSDATAKLIKFDREQLNVGGGYDAHRGMFTAPTTGIYHFWFTVYVTERQFGSQPKTSPTKDNIVKLYAGNSDTSPSYGGYMAPEELNVGTLHINVRVVQGQHAVSLKAGETAYVHLVSSESVKAGSSFGGMMLG